MTMADLQGMMPLLILGTGAVLVLLQGALMPVLRQGEIVSHLQPANVEIDARAAQAIAERFTAGDRHALIHGWRSHPFPVIR